MPALYPSRLQFAGQIRDSAGRLMLETPLLDRFRLRNRPDNVRVRVREGERLWDVAHRVYAPREEAGSYWWVVAAYNGIADPTRALEAGAILVCPSSRVLFDEILGGAA